MTNLISVIVPVYNVEKYLSDCIDSIVNQTYRNLEIILVNDGSTDASGDICDAYQKKDSRIKVIHKENGGLSDARNTGIDASSGHFLFFLDSDDWMDVECISKLHDLLKETGSDISICNFLKVYENKNSNKKSQSDFKVFEYSNLEALEQLTGKKNVQMTVSWGKLIKREIFNDIYFPVGRLHEDQFTTYKILYRAKRVVVTMEQLVYYRQREGSIMNRKKNFKQMFDELDAFKERAEFLNKINLKTAYHRTLYSVFRQMINIKSLAEVKRKEEIAQAMRVRLQKLRPILTSTEQPLIKRLSYKLYYSYPDVWQIFERLYRKIALLRRLLLR